MMIVNCETRIEPGLGLSDDARVRDATKDPIPDPHPLSLGQKVASTQALGQVQLWFC